MLVKQGHPQGLYPSDQTYSGKVDYKITYIDHVTTEEVLRRSRNVASSRYSSGVAIKDFATPTVHIKMKGTTREP